MLKSFYENFMVVAMVLVLASCAHKLIVTTLRPGDGVHPDFVSFLNKFNTLAENYIPDYCQPGIDVGYGNLKNLSADEDSLTIGVCIPTKRPMVLFDESFWKRASETEHEMVAFHEFGHCILDLDHDSTETSHDGHKIKKSLMAPVIFAEWQYAAMYDYYMAELFLSSKKTTKEWKRGCNVKDSR